MQATSESVTENNDDDDNNGGNDNMSVDNGAPLTPPNPVEDTPSPKAKSEGEEEDKPATKPKQRKGQQKLNFFGRHDDKKQDEVCHVF